MDVITASGWVFVIGVVVPVLMALGAFATCGARTRAGGLCLHSAKGPLQRCHQHRGFAWNDLCGLLLLLAASLGWRWWEAHHAGEALLHLGG